MKPARITLTVTQGNLEGKEYVFEEFTRCIIGRAEDCDIRLPMDWAHADVSRHHCALDIDPPAVGVRDLGSRNGTYVNGEKIGQRPARLAAEEADLSQLVVHESHDGDEIRVGSTILRVGIVVPAETPEPVPMYFM